jgi:hypothetical protein
MKSIMIIYQTNNNKKSNLMKDQRNILSAELDRKVLLKLAHYSSEIKKKSQSKIDIREY